MTDALDAGTGGEDAAAGDDGHSPRQNLRLPGRGSRDAIGRGAAASVNRLLLAVAAGDGKAFALLYDLTSAKLFGIVLRMIYDPQRAEDVVQETFIEIWQQAVLYDPARSAAMTWMTMILRRRAIDSLRRSHGVRRGHCRHERTDTPDAMLQALAAGPADDAGRSADLGAVWQCLGELKEVPRRAVLLAYIYGLTHKEIAERLEIPLGTVKSSIRGGLERMKMCLDGCGSKPCPAWPGRHSAAIEDP